LFQHRFINDDPGVDGRQEAALMNIENRELEECVEALKEVRRSMQGDADSCITAAFDEALAKLERCATEDDLAKAARDALGLLGDILTCIAVLGKFFGA
jgi:hypothetical protein